MADLSVQIGKLTLKNPVLTASGTYGYGTEYSPLVDIRKLGGIITKTITMEPRKGNPLPRIAETPAGMLNSIGLANVGVREFLNNKLPVLEKLDTQVIVNIAGNTIEEYGEVAAMVQGHSRVDALELNISCPNVREGGIAFGISEKATTEIVKSVRKSTTKPIITKLTPNVTDITIIARAAADAGSDAVSLINTVLGMGIDIETWQPLLARKIGGLSGPAVKPIAVASVYRVAQAVEIPVIGIGGICRWQDVIEFVLAGATAVQIGTYNFVDPAGVADFPDQIQEYCHTKGVTKISDLLGAIKEIN